MTQSSPEGYLSGSGFGSQMSAKFPMTPAIRALREMRIAFTPHLYTYEERGGAEASARLLGLELHSVIKTLIMEDEAKTPLVVLMHGDRNVWTKELARQMGRRSITPCKPEVARRHSGYLVGGTSPFGLRRDMPILMERSIAEVPKIFVNGGKRGFLVGLDPQELLRALDPQLVSVAIEKPSA